MNTVGEKDHEHLTLGIDPHRRAGETGVAVRRRAEEAARAIVTFGGVPTEGAVAESSRREQLDRRFADDLHAVVLAAI